jgi:hypothetical protein
VTVDPIPPVIKDGKARQATQWTYRYPKPSGMCGFPAIGTGKEKIDFSTPTHLTLIHLRIGGPTASFDVPATITRTGTYTPDLSGLPPSYPAAYGNGGQYTVDHGGCGTVSGTLHLRLRLVSNPERRADQQIVVTGQFHSPLGATLFSVCLPQPPAAIGNGQLLPTTWNLDRPVNSPVDRFLHTSGYTQHHRYSGNPDGFTVTFFKASLDRIDPWGPHQ